MQPAVPMVLKVSYYTTLTLVSGVSSHLSLALALELRLLFFPQLLINLRALGGLVAVGPRGKGGILLVKCSLLALLLVLVLALGFAGELVGD
jgi:hypothetical protein